MLWLIIGYLTIGIAIAEAAVYYKREKGYPSDFDITTDVYSALVLFWFVYLVSYISRRYLK